MSNNPPLPKPDWLQRAEDAATPETMTLGTGERAEVSTRKSPRPRRRERLLDRNDWKTLGVIAIVVIIAGVIAVIVGESIVHLIF